MLLTHELKRRNFSRVGAACIVAPVRQALMGSKRTLQRLSLAISLAAGLVQPHTAHATESPGIADPFAVIEAFDRFGQQKLWPGFEPRLHPIAIYDGEKTLLLRHASPPEGFTPLEGQEGTWAFEGRHPAMRWNSTVPIGGEMTATLLLTIEPGRAVALEASYLLHEVFHLYSKPRHLSWSPDEMARYSYPMDSEENYYLLILEEEALARAVEADRPEVAASWAAIALAAREQRIAQLDPEHLAYETALEMQEGTAVYMARLAVNAVRDTTRLREWLAPEEIRWRFYDTGAALAALLDRFDPRWKDRLEAEPEATLAELLGTTLSGRRSGETGFTSGELNALRQRAERGISELADKRRKLRGDVAAGAIRVVVIAGTGADPLQIQPGTFNPIALEVLDRGEILHYDHVTLVAEAGHVVYKNPSFERGAVAGVLALTTPVGDRHPLLDGFSRVVITGFAEKPRVQHLEDEVLIEAEGFEVRFRGAAMDVAEKEITVRLPDQ
jgi:hypothetical protein